MLDTDIFILVLIAAVLLRALAIWLAAMGRRGKAEADLEARVKRVAALDIRPLTPEERSAFTQEWSEVNPCSSTVRPKPCCMLARMTTTRGYPMADFDRRFEDLTVEHAEEARHYRAGRAGRALDAR